MRCLCAGCWLLVDLDACDTTARVEGPADARATATHARSFGGQWPEACGLQQICDTPSAEKQGGVESAEVCQQPAHIQDLQGRLPGAYMFSPMSVSK